MSNRTSGDSGSDHPLAKMDEEQVEHFRKTWSKGLISIYEAADELGVSRQTAKMMLRGKTWKHVPVYPPPSN